MMTIPRGTIDATTWTILDESKMGDRIVKPRFAIIEQSQQAYTYTWELQGEADAWTTIMDGKVTRR